MVGLSGVTRWIRLGTGYTVMWMDVVSCGGALGHGFPIGTFGFHWRLWILRIMTPTHIPPFALWYCSVVYEILGFRAVCDVYDVGDVM
jgi:hypothetical protein